MVDYQKYLEERNEYKSEYPARATRKWVSDVSCEHCGSHEGPGIQYTGKGGNTWCMACANADGLIDDEQYNFDEKQGRKLDKFMKGIDSKINSFLKSLK